MDATGVNGADGDLDSDGVTNLDEYLNGTDPTLSDTDGDGTSDSDEINQGSDPTDPSDEGNPPDDPSKDVTFKVGGDYALWRMEIQGEGPKDHRKLLVISPKDNVWETKSHKLQCNNKYKVTLHHTGSKPGESDTWYCWEAKVEDKPTEQTFADYSPDRIPGVAEFFAISDGSWLVDNRSGLFTAHNHRHSGSGGGGNAAASLESFLLPVDLDVNGDGDLNDPCDGLATYMPGYELSTAKLHTGTSFVNSQYAGPQSMNIIIDNLPSSMADEAHIRIVAASNWFGYCGNGSIVNESPILSYKDFSLDGQETVSSTQEAMVTSTGNKMVIPIYCHDYGGWCEVEITLKKNGATIGSPIKLALPRDGNGDRLADLWQIQQINDWNAQYSTSLDNTISQLQNTWPQLSGDKEEKDPDKSGPLFSHATAGDGLDVVKEYRGYLTDGGSNTSGGYKRFSVSRKEVLIEVSEMSGIQGAIAGGTNNTANYSLSSSMQATESFYRSKYGVETFWAFDSIVPGTAVAYGDGTGRTNAYISSDSATTSSTGNGPFNMGGANFVWDDQRLKVEDEITYNSMFGSEMDHFNIMNKNPNLFDFIRLRMLSRACMIMPKRDANNNLTGDYFLRYNAKQQAQTTATGSRVEAAFVAAEGPIMLTPPRHYTPGEYNNVINYVIAHECGHLFFGLLDVPSGAGDLMNHASNPGAAGLGACGTSPTECSQLNLVDRKSTN